LFIAPKAQLETADSFGLKSGTFSAVLVLKTGDAYLAHCLRIGASCRKLVVSESQAPGCGRSTVKKRWKGGGKTRQCTNCTASASLTSSNMMATIAAIPAGTLTEKAVQV
jgi:hypothetical protein